MSRRILVLLTATLLALLLAACTSADSPEPSSDGDAPDGDTSDGDTDPDGDDPDGDGPDGDDGDGDAPDGDNGDGDTADGDDPDGDDPDGDEPEPWNYREPWQTPQEEWSTCPQEEYIGGKTLHEKAAYYDWIVPKLHQIPADAPGYEDNSRVHKIQCDDLVPAEIVPDEELPFCTFPLSENNGLWTGLYVASQAFRYAATGDAQALAQLRRTLNGTYQMLKITGKPGLYTRDFRDPSLPQQYCIEDEPHYANAETDNGRYARYTPPSDRMVGNQFVKIDTDGCFMYWDTSLNDGNGGWVKQPEHCTDTRFAGFCWQRNVSKDEYSGHMLAAGIVAKIVDDPESQAIAADILGQVGHHLVDNHYWFTDYDGRITRYGSVNAMSLDSVPGSNALIALAWTKMGAVVNNDEKLIDAYDNCLLQKSGEKRCIEQPFENPKDYREYLGAMGYNMGCGNNYDTINIGTLAYFNLIWFEADPDLRELYRQRFRENTLGPDSKGRNLWAEANPFMNMILVSRMDPDAYDAEEVKTLIEDSVCTLKRFPTDNIRRAKDNSHHEHWCQSERHGSLAADPIPIEDRCQSVFEWWGDPNEREVCGENLTVAEPPAGFLLPYWMGRYFGYISADM